MSDLTLLNNLRSLRAQARGLELSVLEELLGKLTSIVSDRREEEHQRRAAQADKLAKLEAIRAQLQEEGIDPAELLSPLSTKKGAAKSKRAPRAARYKYTDDKGQQQTWTGQGRTPKAIAQALEKGKKLEDFEI
ncbi:H-NS family nucleoid-associated regulatory protein [Cedecea sp.]|jgi:DNA-binding protein H-NS|uniref:H-NS family histone-like protein n=1 Tax=Cedecea sp. TaxID=1970739 RepID=UPI002F3F677F